MYAATTTVPIEKTQGEIRKLLGKQQAKAFSIMEGDNKAALIFELQNRRIVFKLPMPKPPQNERSRGTYEQLCRSKWRGLLLVLKAKFEAVESGITTLEEEFLAHVMLPDGRVFGEWAIPQLQESYENQQMPPLLGGAV